MNTDTADDDKSNSAGPIDPVEASVGALNKSTSDHDVGRQKPQSGQCNRTLGRHFISSRGIVLPGDSNREEESLAVICVACVSISVVLLGTVMPCVLCFILSKARTVGPIKIKEFVKSCCTTHSFAV